MISHTGWDRRVIVDVIKGVVETPDPPDARIAELEALVAAQAGKIAELEEVIRRLIGCGSDPELGQWWQATRRLGARPPDARQTGHVEAD
ncbi:MAG: hypothetical protein U0168_01845 [Nannocystaceae bacterium]